MPVRGYEVAGRPTSGKREEFEKANKRLTFTGAVLFAAQQAGIVMADRQRARIELEYVQARRWMNRLLPAYEEEEI